MKKHIKVTICILLLAMSFLGIYTYLYSQENVHLGKYRGLSTDMTIYNVTDGDIQTSLNELAEKYPNKKKVLTGTVKSNQKVTVDYSYKLKNETREKKSIEVTAGIDSIGFESKLVGKIVGETTEILVNYGDDESNEELKNQNITYKVTIKNIIEESTPKITNAFIKKHTKYNNIDEYKNYLKSEFITSYEKNAETQAGNKLISQIIKTSRVRKFPKDEVTKYEKNLKASYSDAASQMGITFEELLKYMNMDEKEFEKNVKNEAIFYVSKKLIVGAIANRQHISLTDNEYNEYLQNIANTYEDFNSVEDVQIYIDKNKTEDDLKSDALAEKVIKYLLKHNNITKHEESIEYQSVSISI